MSEMPSRNSDIGWIPISKMRISPAAQRKWSKGWSSQIAAEFDPNKMGIPVVSYDAVNDIYWVQDGQHRVEALKMLGWDDQSIECEVYDELDEKDRAELFLSRNSVKNVSRLDMFNVAVTAGHPIECDIVRIAERLGLSVGAGGKNRVGAVSALDGVYQTAGPDGLFLTLKVIRDAFGSRGFEAGIIRGIGMFVQRYGTKFDEARLISALANRYGGLNALLGEAESIQQKRRYNRPPKPTAIAEATVTFYNEAARSGRLAQWDAA